MNTMFLNVSQCAAADAAAPKTPEILNSLISLTSPPLPPTYAHYQGGTAELLSPDCSTPGDECGGGGWGGVGEGAGVESGNTGTPPCSISSRPSCPPSHLPSQYTPQHLYSSSSLLTPTSDGSPPPPPAGGGGCELPSPVSTVEATMSALIKEGLKQQITTKLKQTGIGPEELLAPGNTVIKLELTPEDEERRRRRRERNKVAATKCRNKKKEMTEILMTESETVEEMNARLKGEVQRLTSEKDRLEQWLSDTRHRANCKHTRRPNKNGSKAPLLTVTTPEHSSPQPPLPSYTSSSPAYASPSSTSSYCSSSSPCSFTSLLSPSDSKEFVANYILPQPPPPVSASSPSYPSSESGFGAISVASTGGSLDYIEPTIPLDTASTTKVLASKSKASSRYHPYLYSGPHSTLGSMRQDSVLNNNYPSSSLSTQCTVSSNTPQYTELSSVATDSSREYCSVSEPIASQTYVCSSTVTVDTKTNPFRYPTVSPCSSQHQDQQQQLNQTAEFSASQIPHAAAAPRTEYRRGKAERPSSAALSRYSPYSLTAQQNCKTEEASSAVTTAAAGFGCGLEAPGLCAPLYAGGSCVSAVTSSHHNPFFPPACSYGNL